MIGLSSVDSVGPVGSALAVHQATLREKFPPEAGTAGSTNGLMEHVQGEQVLFTFMFVKVCVCVCRT